MVRKIMECSLHGSDIKVLIRLSKAQRKMFQIKRKTEDTRNQDAIIIKAKPGSTYSDVVKELKKSMSPDEIGVTVKRINSTLTGNVRIQLAETKEGGRQKMVERIRAQVKTAEETKIQRRTKGIVIMEMEDDIDSDFVKGCLSSALNIDSEDIRTNPIRKMQRGTQMVTVFLPHEAATAAITMGKIKIGWTMCPVKERSDPPLLLQMPSIWTPHGLMQSNNTGKQKVSPLWVRGTHHKRLQERRRILHQLQDQGA